MPREIEKLLRRIEETKAPEKKDALKQQASPLVDMRITQLSDQLEHIKAEFGENYLDWFGQKPNPQGPFVVSEHQEWANQARIASIAAGIGECILSSYLCYSLFGWPWFAGALVAVIFMVVLDVTFQAVIIRDDSPHTRLRKLNGIIWTGFSFIAFAFLIFLFMRTPYGGRLPLLLPSISLYLATAGLLILCPALWIRASIFHWSKNAFRRRQKVEAELNKMQTISGNLNQQSP